MTENEQKQQLSIAYVHAVASRAGYACQVVLVDDDSVDVELAARGRVHEHAVLMSPKLQVQLKATSQGVLKADHVAFPLPRKNYDELRVATMCPRLLVVLLLPANPEEWLEQTEERMITRRSAYWCSLLGMPASDNSETVSIRLPRSNVLSVENLRLLMERASRKEPL